MRHRRRLSVTTSSSLRTPSTINRTGVSLAGWVTRLAHVLSHDDRRGHRRVIRVAFAALGTQVGVWTVLLADVIAGASLSLGALGWALAVLSGGAIVTSLVGGVIGDRLGRRTMLLLGIGGSGAFFAAMPWVIGSAFPLAVFFFLGGLAWGWYDLAVSTLGGDFERHHHETAMIGFHARFSLGAAAGAIGVGLALTAGATAGSVFAAVGIAFLGLALALARSPLPPTTAQSAPGDISPLPGAHPLPAVGSEISGGDRPVPAPIVRAGSSPITPAAGRFGHLLPWRGPGPVSGVVIAAAIVPLAFLPDAALEGYISFYVRTVLGSGPLLAALAIAAFHQAVATRRLGGGKLLLRHGERRVLVGASLGAAAGLALVIATGSPAVAAVGLLVMGLALAPVAPVVFSMAARSAPGREARAVARVSVCLTAVFLVGPVVIGTLADATSTRVAWLLPLAGLLTLAAVSTRFPAAVLLPPGGRSEAEEPGTDGGRMAQGVAGPG
ncbi:MAG: MFS transporter [Thermomicrobiales bacterium]